MKYLIMLPAILASTCFAVAQNVGVGTNFPSAKLEVKDSGRTVLKVSSANFNDTSLLIMSNRVGGTGTDFLISARQESGLYFSTNSDYTPFINDSLFTMLRSGSIGIGTKKPLAPLHINSNISHVLRIEGNHPYLSLYDVNDGYRGYLWYPGNSIQLGSSAVSALPVTIAPALAFNTAFLPNGNVGIGIISPVHKLDVAGDINATAYRFNTPKTYYYSVGYWDFVGRNNTVNIGRRETSSTIGWGAYIESGDPKGFNAVIHLPHGAVVTKMSTHYFDQSSTSSLRINLRRNTSDDIMCSAVTVDGGAVADNTIINNATIDNSENFYSIDVDVIGAALPSPASALMIRHIIIEYTLTSL